eukprot:s309_g6.t1
MALSWDFVKEEVDYDGDEIYEDVLEEQEDKSTQQSKERGGYCHICWLWLKDDSTRSMERHRRHSQRCRRWQEWQAGGRAQVKAPCGKCGQMVVDSRDAMWQHQRTAKCARRAAGTPTRSRSRDRPRLPPPPPPPPRAVRRSRSAQAKAVPLCSSSDPEEDAVSRAAEGSSASSSRSDTQKKLFNLFTAITEFLQ